MLRVEVFVPVEPALPAQGLADRLLDESGGLTYTEGVGKYITADNKVVTEPVRIILCFIEDTDESRLWLESICRDYKETAEQEAVLYVLNGTDFNLIED